MSPATVSTTIYGLCDNADFILKEAPGSVGLYTLGSVADARVRLLVLDADIHLRGYEPELDEHEDRMLLVIVNTSDGAVTANLAAPLVIAEGVCRQVILDAGYSIREPLDI